MEATKSVTWFNDNLGEVTRTWYKGTCYKPEYAVKMKLLESCEWVVRSPIWSNNEIKIGNNGLFNPLRLAEPPFNPEKIINISNQLGQLVLEILNRAIADHNLADSSISDAVFLALLGKQRNWKSGCAICLTDEIMGTPCSCGHTEIIIFRPCGHSICVKPCFEELMKHAGVRLQQRIIKINGLEFITPEKMQVNNISGFPCPLCRTEVISTFRAEEIRFSLTELHTDDYISRINY